MGKGEGNRAWYWSTNERVDLKGDLLRNNWRKKRKKKMKYRVIINVLKLIGDEIIVD